MLSLSETLLMVIQKNIYSWYIGNSASYGDQSTGIFAKTGAGSTVSGTGGLYDLLRRGGISLCDAFIREHRCADIWKNRRPPDF